MWNRKLQADWEKIHDKLCVFLPHEHLEPLENIFAVLPYYIEQEEVSLARAECQMVKNTAEHSKTERIAFEMCFKAKNSSPISRWGCLHNWNLSVALGLDLIELVHERIDVFEFTVNGSKANIGHFVDLLELIHGISADERGRHFAVERVLQERFRSVYDALKCSRYWAFRGRRAEGRSTACCG